MTEEPAEATPDHTPLRAFSWEEMGERIGRGADWVRRHTRDLPHHRYPGRGVMFCDRCVETFLKQTLVLPPPAPNPLAGTPRSQAIHRSKRAREQGW